MGSESTVVRVDRVSKQYMVYAHPADRFKQSIVKRLAGLTGRPTRAYAREFTALRDVSFQVRRGETVGVIGRNGCGKSTLLQIICGTLRPSSGSVETRGRVAALLELGAGFNPEFTGRENAHVNGAILGLGPEEMAARFDDIAAFAGIGDFIDQPVKTYSSGMYVRLAFAVAINVDPDVLVVDEALSVGDEGFQRKCFARIEQMQERGVTILFVSHAAQVVVALCDRTILLDEGELLLEGWPNFVVNQYQRLLNVPRDQAGPIRDQIRSLDGYAAPAREESQPEEREASESSVSEQDDSWFDPSLRSESAQAYESRGAIIRDARLLTPAGRRVNVLRVGCTYVYEYDVDFTAPGEQVGFGMLIKSVHGIDVAGTSTGLWDQFVKYVPAGSRVTARFSFVCNLHPGAYLMNAGTAGLIDGEREFLHRVLDVIIFRVKVPDQLRMSGLVDLGIRPEIVAS